MSEKQKRKPAAYTEAVMLWRGIRSTLRQRGLLKQKRKDGEPVVPCAHAVVLPEKVLFVLDMNRLAGISREEWLNEDLWEQWRAALQGRRCFVADGAGLAITVAREPGQQRRQQLPKVIRLTDDELPRGHYAVTLGYDRRGRVVLDLAEAHRAMLIGGASGGGKSNAVQALLAQLMLKHTPQEAQLAIIDTKEIDFTNWHGLPHLFAPVAHTLEESEALIEEVEQERRRRKAMMTKAGVKDWRRLENPLPLLVLIVDEAADFTDTDAMNTLTQVARKGRAFGVATIIATQYPTSDAIDKQIKANLTTSIAFMCRTATESRVIIDRGGAEDLSRPGLALAYIDGQWRKVQVLLCDDQIIEDLKGASQDAEGGNGAVLSDVESALVAHAVEELGGAFKVDPLYEAMKGDISRRQVVKRGRQWEQRGWLTPPQRDENGHPIGRQVTPELKELAGVGRAGTREQEHAHEDPTISRDGGKAGKAVQRAGEGRKSGKAGVKTAIRGAQADVEEESPISPALSPYDCPVTDCPRNKPGGCFYAKRGMECQDQSHSRDWHEAMESEGSHSVSTQASQ